MPMIVDAKVIGGDFALLLRLHKSACVSSIKMKDYPIAAISHEHLEISFLSGLSHYLFSNAR